MKILHKNKFKREAFTLVEVCVALVVTALFGLAAFATNSRLVLSLKSQKESTAATMMLQERKESLRGTAFASIADATKLQAIFTNPTTSEGPLGSLSEDVKVSALTSPTNPTPSGTATELLRNPTYPNCQILNNATLSGQKLLRVDVVLTWPSVDGQVIINGQRYRIRQFSEVFTAPGNT
jgi:type II secretory pathway pseudopilin PulG